jgi:hypothetical protein
MIRHFRAWEKRAENSPPLDPVEGWGTRQLPGTPFVASDGHLSGYPTYQELARRSQGRDCALGLVCWFDYFPGYA